MADGIAYIDEDGNPQTANNVTAITDDTATLTDGWYVVSGSVSHVGRITVSATTGAHLILADGCNYTVTGGMEVTLGNSLTIYGQSADSGTLTATATSDYNSGIGSSGSEVKHFGSITINGGIVIATGSSNSGSGIGSGASCLNQYGDDGLSGGFITINGGTVTGNGGGTGAGIGGGDNYGPGITYVNINGGTVRGIAGSSGTGAGGSGIGGSLGAGWIVVNITGGTVKATGHDYYGYACDIGNGYVARSGVATVITGGSVLGTRGTPLEPQPTDGNSNNVYLTTLTLTDIPNNTNIAAATCGAIIYNTKGMSTSDESSGNSKLYFYLPVSTYAENTIKTVISSGLILKNAASVSVDSSGTSVGTLSTSTLSGVVSIIGNPVEGEVLSVDTDSLEPSDYDELSYVWKRSGSDDPIGTGATYTLTSDDIGHTITVTVSTSSYLGTVTSDPTDVVTPAPVYSIELSQTGVFNFEGTNGVTFGYAAITPKSVTVTNTGNQSTGTLNVSLSGNDASAFEVTQTSSQELSAQDDKTTFTVFPKTGLAVRTAAYSANVTVTGAANELCTATFPVSFKVNAKTPADLVTYGVSSHFGTYSGSGTISATVEADLHNTEFLYIEVDGGRVDPDAQKYDFIADKSKLATDDMQISSFAIADDEVATTITLTEAYAKTFATGDHVIVAYFSDGKSDPINLKISDVPTSGTPTKTGDDNAINFLLTLGGLSLITLLALIAYRRKTQTA
ncbi:MAG: hypothetical protein LBN34_00380 [Clostridiales Family XIII bacterium]|nr:hypothetical protein [Clostridiales Family XIII bacterium]